MYPVHNDLSSSIASADRAAELLSRMTVEEKAQQVVGIEPFGLLSAGTPSDEQLEAELTGGVGHVCMFAMFQHHSLAEHARRVNQVQRYLVEHTRLGIPAMFHIEALGGLVAPHFTVFPTGIALAATWNPAAVERMATILGQQARAIGYAHALSPVMDVARDARWGRVHETYGEDPYLVSEFSVAFTSGIQGGNLRTGAIATGKHFLGFAAAEGGQHMAATAITSRELREVYARPFEAAIRHAGLRSIMNSYSSVDGIPVVANREILTSLLRGELEFEGSVVADYGSVDHLVSRTGVARDLAEAAALALEAGLDLELPSAAGFGPVLSAAVRSGAISEHLLDRAALHVLRDKFDTGIMDSPYVSEDERALAEIASQGVDLARELARESVVMLSNDGTLPIRRTVGRITVIGPHGDSAVVGHPAYTYLAALGLLGAVDQGAGANMAGLEHSSLSDHAREALRSQLGPELIDGFEGYARRHYGSESLAEALRRLSGAVVDVVKGCGILDDEPRDLAAAVEAARSADLVVLALGGRAGWFGSRQTEGEGSDQADVSLPDVQLELARAVANTGVPIVGVMFAGRPIAFPELASIVPTLVYAQYGGQWASTAVAEILLGDREPTGRLPISLPRHSGQMTVHSGQHRGSGYRRTAADPHSGYNDMPANPLFPFGHGIGYTSFSYGELSLHSPVIEPTGSISVSVAVTNTGERKGVEVVQFYVSHRAVGVTRPAQQLIAFARVALAPGERKVARAVISLGQLAYLGRANTLVFEASPVEVQVGSSSEDIRSRAVQLVDGATADWSRRRPLMPAVTVEVG